MKNRRQFLQLAAGATTLLPLGTLAGSRLLATTALREGTDYTLASNATPLPSAGERIRITEFFNYSCPACNSWYPQIELWLAEDKPEYVDWQRTPLEFSRYNGLFARTHYVFEAFDRTDLADEFFAALHDEGKLLNSEERIADWMAEYHGLDADKALKAFSSFSVNTKMKSGARRAENFGIRSTPTFMIAEHFILVPSHSNGPTQLFGSMDEIVAKLHAGEAIG